ncbi:MAG: sigma-70 family RNA polymerase sigma factor [Planctomycetota bacterium]
MPLDPSQDNSAATPEAHLKAVQSLFIRNQTALRGLILGIVSDINRAEDVLQDVFFVITDKADSFKLGSNFLAWAMQIAKFRIMELTRADRAKGPSLTPDLIDQLVQSYKPNDKHEEMLQLLRDCIERLSPSARQFLTLRYHGRLKPAQISKDRGLAVETVYSVLSKTRAALRDCIQRRMKTAGGSR